MQKVVTILFLLMFLAGCSATRKAGFYSGSDQYTGDIDENNRILVQNNFTAKSFFIEKAEVEYVADGEKQSLLASVKFKYPDKYLVSLRSKSGIEAARIFISGDTILANDRINQVFYTGNTKYLESKVGIDYRLLGLLFGDIVFGNPAIISTPCSGKGLRTIDLNAYGKKVSYIVDCRRNKVISSGVIDSNNKRTVILKFDYFLKYEYTIHPSGITLTVPDMNIIIKIRLKKINYNFDDKLEFIPGAKYDKKVLL